MNEALKLEAQSKADIEVLSAILQDATVRVGDLAWLPSQRRFAAVLNRYRWEGEDADGGNRDERGERVRSGIHFNGVLRVEQRHVPLGRKSHIMELLAIEVEEGPDGTGTILLDFSGYATIRLHVECLEARLADLTDPWPARCRPAHAAR